MRSHIAPILILICIAIVILIDTGCTDAWKIKYKSDGFEDVIFNEIPPLNLTSVHGVMLWVADNIDYKADGTHYFQSPGETYTKGTGDCEDFAALAMYLLMSELGIYSSMQCGYDPGGHAWVDVHGDWWEPQNASRCEVYRGSFKWFEKYSYSETMYRAVELKRSAL